MAQQTFSWFPDQASQLDEAPRVRVTKFGDGYESRTPEGINTIQMKWSLTFTRGRDEALAIRDFLRDHGASLSFAWTNPFEELGSYVCRSWKTSPDRGKISVTATFEQVFEVV